MTINAVAEGVLRDSEIYLKAIDENVYKRPLDLLFGASIGQHTRHFIEFYQCLLDQIDSEDRIVNYSLRLRNPAIEENPAVAQSTVDRIGARLRSLDGDAYCRLQCNEHLGDNQSWVDSNLTRELLYNIEHTIHHLAIIKIGLAAVAPSIELPEHFGVAPSTIRHKQSICAQ